MYGIVLQDWITIRGASNTTINQSESAWVGLSAYQDIVFWLDVREITPPTAGNVTVNYQTAPIKDELLFATMGTSGALTTVPANPLVKPILLTAVPTIPLGRWVRWQLSPSTNAAWDITFRLLACVNAVGLIGSAS